MYVLVTVIDVFFGECLVGSHVLDFELKVVIGARVVRLSLRGSCGTLTI